MSWLLWIMLQWIRVWIALQDSDFVSFGYIPRNELAILYKSSIFNVLRNLCKAMAAHSSTLAWEIPWTEEPGRLQSVGSRRVGHDWATSLSFFTFMHWRRKWQPTPVFLPGESQGREPGGLLSMGSHRVGHDWYDLAAAVALFFRVTAPFYTPINCV